MQVLSNFVEWVQSYISGDYKHTSGYRDVKKIINKTQHEVKVSAGLYVGFFADDNGVGRSWQNILDRVDGSMNDELYELIRYIRNSGRELTWRYDFNKDRERPWLRHELSLTNWVKDEMVQQEDNLYIYWDERFTNDLAQFKHLTTFHRYNKITIKIQNEIYAEVKNFIDSLGFEYKLILFDE